MLIGIWAQDKNGVIGKDGNLPWYIPRDLQLFKETTMGETVVMGRTTFEGMGKRVLPGRRNIVLTSDKNYHHEGVEVLHSTKEVLDKSKGKVFYIIGGSKVFESFMPFIDLLTVSVIDGYFDGDAMIPDVDWWNFDSLNVTQEHDKHSGYDFEIKNYVRKGAKVDGDEM